MAAKKAIVTPHGVKVEKIDPKDPALKMVTITIPKDRNTKIPYSTGVMVPGFGAKHYVIPRGRPVQVPMYVAQAIKEDLKQQDDAEVLMEKLNRDFLGTISKELGIA